VETIFLVAAERRALGQVYQSSPIALRFVKASPAYLSMMHGRDTMMIELIGLNGNDGGIELLKAYEEALYALGGRPHWGHINTLTGSHGFVESMYPRLGDWMDVRTRLDPGGVFDSAFTKRVGCPRTASRRSARGGQCASAPELSFSAWGSIGSSTPRHSRTAFGLPGRLTISVRPRVPATARESQDRR